MSINYNLGIAMKKSAKTIRPFTLPKLPLVKGDLVEVISPGSRTTQEVEAVGLKALNKWGLIPRVWSDPTVSFHPFHSSDDDFRFFALKSALFTTDSKIIWCERGGYGSIRLLEQLRSLKKPKVQKLFLGFSDITTIHLFLTQEWGWKTLHAPVVASFAQKSLAKKDLTELKTFLFSSEKYSCLSKIKPMNLRALNEKSVIKGKMTGGNLSVIQTTLGTKLHIQTKGKILFLEDVGERGYRIDRMLSHLKEAGVFKGVKAVVFGEFSDGKEPDGESFVAYALQRFANESSFPVFKSNEFGHGKRNRFLVMNHEYLIEKNVLKMN